MVSLGLHFSRVSVTQHVVEELHTHLISFSAGMPGADSPSPSPKVCRGMAYMLPSHSVCAGFNTVADRVQVENRIY